MSTKRKSKLHFADLPGDYAGLCRILIPRPIRDKTDYANTVEVTDAMAVCVEDFSADQEDYFDVLCTLIEVYDATHVKWKEVKPLKLLQRLVNEHGLSGADLSRVLGATSRHLGSMILRGERKITAAHARVLGAYFGLPAGTFIG